MRGVAEIRDLIAHPRLELEFAPVAQFAIEFAFQHVEHMSAVAPVIGEVTRRILHHPHPQVADLQRPPRRLPGIRTTTIAIELGALSLGELDPAQWSTLLAECGFDAVEAFPSSTERAQAFLWAALRPDSN